MTHLRVARGGDGCSGRSYRVCEISLDQIQGIPSCQGTKYKGATVVALELKSHPARSPRPRDVRVFSPSGHRFRRLRRLCCPYELRLLTPIPWNTGGCGWSTRYRTGRRAGVKGSWGCPHQGCPAVGHCSRPALHAGDCRLHAVQTAVTPKMTCTCRHLNSLFFLF